MAPEPKKPSEPRREDPQKAVTKPPDGSVVIFPIAELETPEGMEKFLDALGLPPD